MNTVQPSPAREADDPALAEARQLTLIVYVLHVLLSLTVLTFFVAICINYARRDRVLGTIYESHFGWQIRTFWWSLLYFSIGAAVLATGIVRAVAAGDGLGWIIVGVLLLVVNWCWHLYRVVRGLLRWSDRRPI